MESRYKDMVIEMSLFYLLLGLVLPLIYAVTYHLSFMDMFTGEWAIVLIFLYPSVFLLAGVRYGYRKLRKTGHS